ncbi:polyhydroxyalkanoate synthase [Ancylobacter sp. 3268]|uniref:class I poly(R)-hydroxyalkanoic acid synthase n=1 Tax=Ancylobacter sp. 3268 TaxID=2817752 RepID=UPI00285851EE|nr:polyhydroxyalkanoate synthase [Ancylobacter sp. 3268]
MTSKNATSRSATLKPAATKDAATKAGGAEPAPSRTATRKPLAEAAAPVVPAPLPRPRRVSQTRSAASHARSVRRPEPEIAAGLTVNVAVPPQPAPASAPTPAPRTAERPNPPAPGPVDFETFAGNLARLVEEGGKAMAAYLRPREEGRVKDDIAEEVADVMKTLGHVAEYWLTDPQRTVDVQSRLIGGYLSLWSSTLKRLAGEEVAPIAQPPARDGRFVDPEWTTNPFFDALKQTYLLTANWAEKLVEDAEIDKHTKHKAEFYVRQIASAVSPSNFVFTNPELLRATLASNGENLVRGMKMLAEDIEAGDGELKIRQTDNSKFKVGVNLAVTPGKVIFQNELMQLIQYSPATETVLKVPVVIVPPWINKFYVLDLNPEKSFVRWAVAQGLTVFIISWVNPSPALADKGFEDYMHDGVLTAIEVARRAADAEQVHAVGYCVGGTMLAMTLAWLAAAGKEAGIRSATYLTTQVDFTHAGDLKVFIDEEQVAVLERRMLESGIMDGRVMANAFNMLRANDLIWPYVVNNYLKGQAPFPFDILYWNADSTRLPRANHSFYLRNCYLDNKFATGHLTLDGHRLDLGRVAIPTYSLATREDHIAPAVSVFNGLQLFGAPTRFVLAGSGHIAGVINPPARAKYQYWTGDAPAGSLEAWIAAAEMHPGSWWPDWLAWLEAQDAQRVPAREPGGGVFAPIEDAPGSYVKVKA